MNKTLLTDLYEITMLQAHFQNGTIEQRSVFDMFYRKNPFENGFVVFAGLDSAIDYLKNLRFSDDDILYLKSLQIFKDDFLNYLKTLKFEGNLYSVKEGSIVFPNEPLVRVEAPIAISQLIESMLLNTINFQSLIATKASRVVRAAKGRGVIEFGLRRAQGCDGAVSASRASFIGGCIGTSNVLAGKLYDIPVKGTHAHSWIMSFESELDAFNAYADVYPDKSILLVDTYDSIGSGIPHAIAVAKKLQERNHKLVGIRLDSGDTISIAKEARRMLDNAGLNYVKILISGDLDEYAIEKIVAQNTPADIFGVGTKLATAYDEPALSGIYKLSAIERNGNIVPTLKISDEESKGNLPGVKNVVRYYKNGKISADIITLQNSSNEELEPVTFKGKDLKIDYDRFEELLIPIFLNGEAIYSTPDLKSIQDFAKKEMEKVPENCKRFDSPENYPVLLSKELYNLRKSIIEDIRREIPKERNNNSHK